MLTIDQGATGSASMKRVRLRFDGTGAALLAHRNLDMLRFARCTSGCATGSAGWAFTTIADSTTLPLVVPANCTPERAHSSSGR